MVISKGSGHQNPGGQKLDKIVLADGKEYQLAPLTLNRLCEVEDLLGQSWEEALKTKQLKVLRALLYVRLKGFHTTMTLEQAGELVTPEIMSKLGEVGGVS